MQLACTLVLMHVNPEYPFSLHIYGNEPYENINNYVESVVEWYHVTMQLYMLILCTSRSEGWYENNIHSYAIIVL